MNAYNKIVVVASVCLGLAVLLGAFGAHLLEPKLAAESLQHFKTANFYHFIHGLALLWLASQVKKLHTSSINWIFTFLLLGIILFSFSLYALAISTLFVEGGVKILGMITPFGGTAFIIGWTILGIQGAKVAYKRKSHNSLSKRKINESN